MTNATAAPGMSTTRMARTVLMRLRDDVRLVFVFRGIISLVR
jgi:hypothetical protein